MQQPYIIIKPPSWSLPTAAQHRMLGCCYLKLGELAVPGLSLLTADNTQHMQSQGILTVLRSYTCHQQVCILSRTGSPHPSIRHAQRTFPTAQRKLFCVNHNDARMTEWTISHQRVDKGIKQHQEVQQWERLTNAKRTRGRGETIFARIYLLQNRAGRQATPRRWQGKCTGS